ncbi:hypothetical protein [Humibacillus xanthopallidus]|uniref:Uncharacterized protein n=1 Tax=Humibacillus xanthopallidus TaxID=412689 RepID=A0A543I3G1_9MICO|nr:hypothetical protein [Humibacillus xanthopallidus]TQM65010.1 hypothetical protein FBY41_1392 [Humibacillus xanthopallidus]
MTITTESERLSAAPQGRRRTLRLTTAILCGVTAVAYLVLALLVARAQSSPGWTDVAQGGGRMDSIYGIYIFAAVPYLIGAALSVRLDRTVIWVLGACTQVAILAGLLWLGLAVIGPGGPEAEPTVFDYAPLSGLGMAWWAAAISGAQVVLLALLTYLALTPEHRQGTAAAE